MRAIKWLTKVTRRFFWMASTRVRSIEAAVRELVRSGAAGWEDTVASKRWLNEDDIAAVIIFSSSYPLVLQQSYWAFGKLVTYVIM